jgi:hypothetical protein
VQMGRQHVRGGVLFLRQQQKTGTPLEIPVHPELQAVLDATPSNHLTFLTTSLGKPFSAAGFTNWFHECCNEAAYRREPRRMAFARLPADALPRQAAQRT